MERSTDFTYEDWLAGGSLPTPSPDAPAIEDPALEVHALASEFVDEQEKKRVIDLEVLNKIEHHQKTCFRKAAEIKGAFRLHLFKRDAKYAPDYSEAIHAELEVLANNPVLNNYWKDVRKGVVLVNGLSGPVCKRIDEAYHRFQKEGIEGLTEVDPTEIEYSQNPDQWADDTLLNWLHTNGSELLQAMAMDSYRRFLKELLDSPYLVDTKCIEKPQENEPNSPADRIYQAQEWLKPLMEQIARLSKPQHEDIDRIFEEHFPDIWADFDNKPGGAYIGRQGFAKGGYHKMRNISKAVKFLLEKKAPNKDLVDFEGIRKALRNRDEYKELPWKTTGKTSSQ